MADPATPFSQRKSDPSGVGPFTFHVGAVASGERAIFDLREMEKGRYVVASSKGYDSIEITNNSTGVTLEVEINESRSIRVPPNAIQSFNREGMYRFDVWATDGALSDGEVTLEVAKDAFGADEESRREATQSPLRGVVRHFTGL